MPGTLAQIQQMMRYKPASRTGRFAYRLSLAIALILALGLVFHGLRELSFILAIFLGFILAIVFLFLGVRVVNRKVLWKVRNRLILTYLLMGLAPIVLFGTITGIAAWFLVGQYATNSAITVLDEAERRVQYETNTAAMSLNSHPVSGGGKIALSGDFAPGQTGIALAYLDQGVWRALPFTLSGSKTARSPFADRPNPSWLQRQFDGVIAVDGRIYLCSLAVVGDGKTTTTLLGSIPVEQETLTSIAKGLGRILIKAVTVTRSGEPTDDLPPNVGPSSDGTVGDVAPILRPEGVQHSRRTSPSSGKKQGADVPVEDRATNGSHVTVIKLRGPGDTTGDFTEVAGGKVPIAAHVLDFRVVFGAPLPIVTWNSGEISPAVIGVVSRPTALYARLFATSVSTGSAVRVALIIIGILFALLEFFSLFMAVQLARTITEAVAELYQGTTEIDSGNLAHRVKVKQSDQLGALSHSFNSMAASIQGLLLEQREKDRLLNELMIAQEVQKNLFPTSPVKSGSLEVHALCMPARTVSGDYYDWITWDDHQLCIALGDISGKGISAALLMASLNSAVRAFTLGSGEEHNSAPSPASLLGCLNRHLYRSTTMEKYATLFLAFYDSSNSTLTYSNGGHLPPMIISRDGTVQRLECGGAVVGLLDNLKYEQATVQLNEGDLLVAFSDGITEPERQEEEFGEDRLRSFMQRNEHEDLDVLVSSAIGEVKNWIGGAEQPDDMTILLARYN